VAYGSLLLHFLAILQVLFCKSSFASPIFSSYTVYFLRTDSRTTLLQQVYNSPLTWGGPHSVWSPPHVRWLLYPCCKSDVFLSFSYFFSFSQVFRLYTLCVSGLPLLTSPIHQQLSHPSRHNPNDTKQLKERAP